MASRSVAPGFALVALLSELGVVNKLLRDCTSDKTALWRAILETRLVALAELSADACTEPQRPHDQRTVNTARGEISIITTARLCSARTRDTVHTPRHS